MYIFSVGKPQVNEYANVHPQVSDDSLLVVGGLSSLVWLNIKRTSITHEGVERMKIAHKQLHIVF